MADGSPKSEHCTCVRCSKVMENLAITTIGEDGFQPLGGLAFATRGHYGSAYFDPIDGTYLEIVICDECMRSEPMQRITYRSTPSLMPSVVRDDDLTEEELEEAKADLLEALTGSRK